MPAFRRLARYRRLTEGAAEAGFVPAGGYRHRWEQAGVLRLVGLNISGQRVTLELDSLDVLTDDDLMDDTVVAAIVELVVRRGRSLVPALRVGDQPDAMYNVLAVLGDLGYDM